MKTHKTILVILVCIFVIPVMFLLGGCNRTSTLEDKKKEINFPVNEKGYPKNNIVIINGKSYPLKIAGNSHIDSKVDCEVDVKMNKESDVVEVIVPQYLPINNWSIEEKNYIDLISYSRIDFPIEDKYMAEGVSATVQKFQFQITTDETTEILLKWSNIDEIEKLFKNKKEDYLLKIVVSY